MSDTVIRTAPAADAEQEIIGKLLLKLAQMPIQMPLAHAHPLKLMSLGQRPICLGHTAVPDGIQPLIVGIV